MNPVTAMTAFLPIDVRYSATVAAIRSAPLHSSGVPRAVARVLAVHHLCMRPKGRWRNGSDVTSVSIAPRPPIVRAVGIAIAYGADWRFCYASISEESHQGGELAGGWGGHPGPDREGYRHDAHPRLHERRRGDDPRRPDDGGDRVAADPPGDTPLGGLRRADRGGVAMAGAGPRHPPPDH